MTSRPAGKLASDTKTAAAVVGATSVNRATLITPTSGTAVRIIAVQVISTGATTAPARCEIYFGTGANITTTLANWIFAGFTGQSGQEGQAYGESGPVGLVDEVVSIRTSTETETATHFVVHYREEQ